MVFELNLQEFKDLSHSNLYGNGGKVIKMKKGKKHFVILYEMKDA